MKFAYQSERVVSSMPEKDPFFVYLKKIGKMVEEKG